MKKARKSRNYTEKNKLELTHEKLDSIRINKYISNSGYASRREADRLVEAGKVYVNGEICEKGRGIKENDVVEIDGKIIGSTNKKIYIALNKPRGITCTMDPEIANNLANFLSFSERVFPIGRLDKDSCGLLIITNDGDAVNKILRSTNNHDKEYFVKVNKRINDEFIEKMSNGITIYNPVHKKMETTNNCKVERVGEKEFRIILKQGLNRQIRRMCKALDYKVVFLKRERIMNVHLGDLEDGEWRYLSDDEIKKINNAIVHSKKHYI